MERRGAFDYILLETSGVADPGNIAPLFWVDDGLGSSIYLDGIVTLVDARNILRTLDRDVTSEQSMLQDSSDRSSGEHLTTAHFQLSHADVIILNKADLVGDEELEDARQRIKGINSLARLEITKYSRVAQLDGTILDLHAYDQVGVSTMPPANAGHLDSVGNTRLRLGRLFTKRLRLLTVWTRPYRP